MDSHYLMQNFLGVSDSYTRGNSKSSPYGLFEVGTTKCTNDGLASLHERLFRANLVVAKLTRKSLSIPEIRGSNHSQLEALTVN